MVVLYELSHEAVDLCRLFIAVFGSQQGLLGEGSMQFVAAAATGSRFFKCLPPISLVKSPRVELRGSSLLFNFCASVEQLLSMKFSLNIITTDVAAMSLIKGSSSSPTR